MSHDHLVELGLALARGDGAFWLGPDWQPPTSMDAMAELVRIRWLGVWSESEDAAFAASLSKRMREHGDGRLMIEVPDRIDAALAEYYKLAEVCPYFYLRGKAGASKPLSPRQRERSRGDKIAELKRLGPASLVVTGYRSVSELVRLLTEEIAEEAPDLRAVFVTDLASEQIDQLRPNLPPIWASRVHGLPNDVPTLLRMIESQRRVPTVGPALRIGSSVVPLQNLLRTEPPIDQDYLLLTADVIRDPDATELPLQLLRDLLAGREPWRAFAHDLAWERPTLHRERVRQALQRLRSSERRVHVIEIPAEPGAGLTVLLQQIAFEAARSGHPTLLHRSRDGQFDYNALRRFLTDLYQSPEMAKEDLAIPAVLIFDAASVDADAQQLLYDLPDRLNRDDRRALIIRALPIREAASVSREVLNVRRSSQPKLSPDRLKPLDALLSPEERESLAAWARGHGAFAAPAIDAIRNWDHAPDSLPLMIALYFILNDDLRSAAGFGKHLVSRLKRLMPTRKESAELPTEGNSILTAAQVRDAVVDLAKNMGRRIAEEPPSSVELTAIFFTLSALGCLRLVASRSLLADMAGVSRDRVHGIITLLESADLVTADLPLETASDLDVTIRPRAPVAYYTARETAGMRHPAYGRLALEWLASTEGHEDLETLARDGLGREMVNRLMADGRLDRYPIGLLQPLLPRLNRPRDPEHVRFVAYLAIRYLRLPKKHESRRYELAAWQWRHVELLLEVLSWLHPQVVRASVITLHSRGITRYKTAARAAEYEEAETDFLAAVDLARQTQEEHPANILTSLGLLYRGWARWERESNFRARFHEIDRKAEQTLREALRERPGNAFASFGLARYLVDCYEEVDRQLDTEQRASALAEAIELLQLEPEANFLDEWEELYGHAIGLLQSADAERFIDSLVNRGDELGYALRSLRHLGGYIYTEPTENPSELTQIRTAAEELRRAEQSNPPRRSSLADLLRYVVFSADGEERKRHPAFHIRFELLQRLEGTVYLERPLWLYDYAALAFQVGQYHEAAEAFSRLRRGQRFFEVSKDRGQFWTEGPDSVKARQVFLRVVSVGQGGDERGWGRIERPSGYRDLVPFSIRAFASRGKATRVGSGTTCYILLNPAGPYAQPDLR